MRGARIATRRGCQAAIAIVAALLLAGCGSSAQLRSGFPFGPFAGYRWVGPVSSTQASWRVPAIAPGSPAGSAATWIGAEAAGASPAPFIQVGTNELGSGRAEAYYAFWSDVSHHFHPALLFDVRPGDRVTASLRHAGGVWHVAIRDERSGRSAQFTTRQEAAATFSLAQWYQEDTTDGATGRPFPYPQMAPTAFTGVASTDMPRRRPGWSSSGCGP